MAAVDLEAERERARRRREEQLLETRAFRIMRNPGRFSSGKSYPSRWGATREELEKAIEKEWPGDDRAELREEVLAECLELQEQRREDVRHVDPEQWEAEVASDAKTHIEKHLRADPTLSNDELIRRYPGKLPVAASTFYGYASDVRNALGIDGQEMAKARRAAESGAEPEEGKGANPTQRGEGAGESPEPAPPPSPAEQGDTVEIGDGPERDPHLDTPGVDGPSGDLYGDEDRFRLPTPTPDRAEAEPGPEDLDEHMEAVRRWGERAFPVTAPLNGGPGLIKIMRGGRGLVAEQDEEGGTWTLTIVTEDGDFVDRVAGSIYEELFEVGGPGVGA